MKIVKTGDILRIYGDDLETFDKIPAGTYKVDFHQMSGFYLVEQKNFESTEEKIYGSHAEKIQKVLRSYHKFNRSLGLILSGKKGMGKSMFVQLIGEEVVKQDMPVILVTKAFLGIADFIDEIDQECLIIFDEFEKMFSGQRQQGQPPTESQDSLLGLFDGISQTKRMYAITVNDLHRVNDFMLSRPGRFHYHIRFDYPTASEIQEYLQDKVAEEYHGEIQHVISFAGKVKLNYDSLRAIAFELNEGYSFASAIGDLNILTTDANRYDVKVVFADGKSTDLKAQSLNLFGDAVRLEGYVGGGKYFAVSFKPSDIVEEPLQMYVSGDLVQVESMDEEGDPTEDVQVQVIIIKQHREAGVNYRLAY